MNTAGTVSVFVSATSRGLRTFRLAVAESLWRAGYQPVFQEEFDCDHQQVRHLLRDQIAPCDAVVLIVGPAYGVEPRNWPDALRDERRSYTQFEHDIAVELQKPIYRFIAAPTCTLDSYDVEPPELQRAQRVHIERLKGDDHLWYEFHSLDDLLELVGRSRFHRRVKANLPSASIGRWFKGRDQSLETIRRTLLSRPARVAALTAKQAVHGLGGVGKTRLAVEYAYRYATEYSARMYVAAASPSSLHFGLAALCAEDMLNLDERRLGDVHAQAEAALRWLDRHSGWLLILDNVDTPEALSAVTSVLARTDGGHVLITSRLSNWPTGITLIELDVLSIEASVDFLLERTAVSPDSPTARHRRITDGDAVDATALAIYLDGLALALEQAGAYICQHGSSFREYLELLERTERMALAWFDPQAMAYPKSVAVTWQASVDQLYDNARALLRLLAQFAPAPIPVPLLMVDSPENVEIGVGIEQPTRALRELQDYSLARGSLDGATTTVHRLVQDVTRFNMHADDDTSWRRAGLNIIARYIASTTDLPNDVRAWRLWTPLVPHITTVADRNEQDLSSNVSDWSLPRVLNDLSVFLRSRAQYVEAESCARRALALDVARRPPGHNDISQRLNNLSVIVGAVNRDREAEALLRQAIEIDEAGGHPTLALRLRNLGALLQEANRVEEAEQVLRRALMLDLARLGQNHPDVASDLVPLGVLLGELNRWNEAEPLLGRAFAIRVDHFGKRHPEVASAMSNLAMALKQNGRPVADVETLLRQALEIDEEYYGADHPDVARDLNALGWFLASHGRAPEGAPLFERAAGIYEAVLGPEHPRVANVLGNLAGLKTGAEAEALLTKVMRIQEASLGPSHPHVALTATNLAQQLLENVEGKPDADERRQGAEKLLRFALESIEKGLGREHPRLALALQPLAGLLMETARRAEAESLLRRALEIPQMDPKRRLAPGFMLIGICLAKEQFGEAERLSLEMIGIIGPPASVEDLSALAYGRVFLATALRCLGRMNDAEAAYEQAILVIVELYRATGQYHPNAQDMIGYYVELLQWNHGLDRASAEQRMQLLMRAHQQS